jgi:chemotaxis protein CheD
MFLPILTRPEKCLFLIDANIGQPTVTYIVILKMDKNAPKIMQYVNTGEVGFGGIETILNSGAIGSCVVLTAFDPIKNVGAMAHVMLLGTAPLKNQLYASKYAADALDELFGQLESLDVKTENLEICLVGGANVLKRENENIGKDNLNSVKILLQQEQIEIKADEIGGFERRTVLFDIEMGCIYYTVVGSKQKMLWQTGSK